MHRQFPALVGIPLHRYIVPYFCVALCCVRLWRSESGLNHQLAGWHLSLSTRHSGRRCCFLQICTLFLCKLGWYRTNIAKNSFFLNVALQTHFGALLICVCMESRCIVVLSHILQCKYILVSYWYAFVWIFVMSLEDCCTDSGDFDDALLLRMPFLRQKGTDNE